MPSLIGNKPNQVPSNGDLGTLAFQDANAVNITGGAISGNIASTGINIDSNTFVIDATSNRVGVGVASPGSLIHANTSTATNTYLQLSQAGIESWQIGMATSSSSFAFLSSGTERMRITTGGNVGIGTSSPTTKLDVLGSGDDQIRIRSGSDAALIFSETTANKNWKLKPSAGDFYWQYSATAYNSGYSALMALTSSGNLGLGVTPSAWDSGNWTALQLKFGASLAGLSGGYTVLGQNTYGASGTDRYISNGFATQYYQQNGAHVWRTSASGTAGNAITFTQAMTLDASGNLGIGNTSPAVRLHITAPSTAGQAILVNSTNVNGSYQTFQSSGTSYGDIGSLKGISGTGNTTDMALNGRGASGIVAFCINDAEKARINSSGNLLVGTLNGVSSVGRVQSLQADQSNAGLSVDATNASFDYKVVYLNTTRAASTAFDFIQATTGGYGTVQFRVRGDGNVYNTNGVYSTVSDIKLKENIADATSKLEKLNQVRVVNYNLKDSELKQIGFIAQELEQVFPSLVEDNIDKDVSGNDLGTVTKSVKLTVFIPILVKAIQEQQAIINDLKARIETLETK